MSANNSGNGELFQVQVENINLLRTEVTGLQYYDYSRFAKRIEIGDQLELRREKCNDFDNKAIAVYFEGYKIGFVAKEENKILSKLADHGVPLEAFVVGHNKEAGIYKGDQRLMVNIYMPYTFVLED